MKYLFISTIFLAISFAGFLVFAQGNSSIFLTQLFPGQYDNTKFYITLADPEGIGAATVNKANGDWVLGAGRSCLKQFNTGTVTLLPKDFPLKASLTDCKGNKYETSIFPLGTFPITELGNCANEKECEAYCQKPENMGPCLDFAEEHELIPEEEIVVARKMLAAGETEGPGGCRGQAECGEYCDDISHIQECVAFAEKHDLMPPEELAEAKKVAEALSRGVQPPPCNSKSECDDVCRLPENMKTCIDFAKEAGLMPPEELEEAEKFLAALEKGITPPPCGGKDECDEYCSLPENFETCITFAEAAGFMSAEEATMIRRTGGQGPGGCRGKDACEAYCEDPANMEPCINFAIENGFMSPEEAEQAKKFLAAGITSGPGDCKGQKECEEFCENPANQQTCFEFGKQHGLISEEDLKNIEEGKARMMEGFNNAPPEARSCLDRNLGSDFLQKVQSGDFLPSPDIGDKMQECFEEYMKTQREEAERRMEECLAMPCSEALSCFESLSQEQPMEEEGAPAEGGSGENTEIQAKIESCIQEMMPQEGMMPPEGEIPIYDESQGGTPPFIPEGPSQEEIDRMIEEETQRKMQQIMEEEQQRMMQSEIDRMMEEEGRRIMEQQASPPAEQPPESFFEAAKNFLAGLVPVI